MVAEVHEVLVACGSGAQIGEALRGHNESVTCVAVSPDSCRVVSGSKDMTLIVWDVASCSQAGEAIWGHAEGVLCVAYSPNGQFFVCGSEDRTLRIWRTDNHAPMGALIGDVEPLRRDVMWLLPGRVWEVLKCLVAGTRGRVIATRSRATENERCNDTEREEETLNAQFTGISSSQSSHEGESEVCEHDWVARHRSHVTSVVVSPNGRIVVCGLCNGDIRVWEIRSRQQVGEPRPSRRYVSEWVYHRSDVMRLDITAENEVRSMDEYGEELRFRLDERRGLIWLSEHERREERTQERGDRNEAMHLCSGVFVRNFEVRMAYGDVVLATLPVGVRPKAWHFDSSTGILGIGMSDGRVVFFTVET